MHAFELTPPWDSTVRFRRVRWLVFATIAALALIAMPLVLSWIVPSEAERAAVGASREGRQDAPGPFHTTSKRHSRNAPWLLYTGNPSQDA